MNDGADFVACGRRPTAISTKPRHAQLTPSSANLGSHKRPGVRAAIEAAGATLHYLPPYSPDFNPIEKAFSKFKALLRKASERTVEGLWNAIGRLLPDFTPKECANFFKAAGYDAT